MVGVLTLELERLDGLPQDVTFTFPEEEGGATLSAHTLILAAASDVFKGSFYGGLPKEEVVAILGTSRAAFATFLDLLYGREVPKEQLAMTRLLALAGLEDRFLVHKRRVLGVVAERRLTAGDILEVVGLRPSKEFSEAMARVVWRGLEEQKARRVELEDRVEVVMPRDLAELSGRWPLALLVHLLHPGNTWGLELADEVVALVEQVQVEGRKIAEIRDVVEGGLAEEKVVVVMSLRAYLEEKEQEMAKVEQLPQKLVERQKQLKQQLQQNLESVAVLWPEWRPDLQQVLDLLRDGQDLQVVRHRVDQLGLQDLL